MKQVNIKWGACLLLLFATGVGLCLATGKTLAYAIGATLIAGIAVGIAHGFDWKLLGRHAFGAVREGGHVYVLVLIIGMNISMWIASGIVPTIVYYGFDVIVRVNFLPVAFGLSACLAFFLGTGLGTVSTIGIALLTLGKASGIDEAVLMGALISGAYLADRLSPISALVNFALDTVQVTFRSAFKATAKALLPAFVLTGLFYHIVGLKSGTGLTGDAVEGYRQLLGAHFAITPALFIIPLVVLVLSFLGVGALKVLSVGIATGFGCAVWLQHMTVWEGLNYLMFGYSRTFETDWMKAFNIGGAWSMVEVVVVIVGGMALLALFEAYGFIAPIKKRYFSGRQDKGRLFVKTGVLSLTLDAVTCDQTVGILLPGKHLKPVYEANGQSREALYQTIANSGTALAPLMPWNVNAVIIYTITGISAVQYAPYALLNWLPFVFTLFYALKIKNK